MRVLRNFNITKISDLELISNSTDRLDITFHFFGIKVDSNRIREAITRMVERGRIGNITLVSNYHLFDENPPLNLLDLSVNQKSAIREDSEFIISCTAQGSSRMQFQWFKDGAIVNASKATREIWTTVLPPETRDTFTAILGVTKASRMDEGVYTCKVTDWGIEQCRSMHIHIKSPPRLRVDPASVTLQRGDSLRVRCLSPGNDDIKRYAQLGYSWTKNGNLFQSDPTNVMWEDLYPDGSILKINSIQQSAEYTCIVSNTVKPVSKSIYITVIDRNAVHVCHTETLYGVRWPTSAPGAAIISDCPRGFEGHSRRICEKHDAGNSSWLLPDFSLCIRDKLLFIHDEFSALRAGFQQSNSSSILKACFDYTLKRYKNFLPGEAGFLIDMLHEVDSYLQLKGTQLEREMAAEIILHILDKVMQNSQSLNSQQQIKKLQLLTQSAALNRETIAASQLATSTSSASASSGAGTATGATGILEQSPNDELQDATSSSTSSASSSSTLLQTTTSGHKTGSVKVDKQATAPAATSTLLKSFATDANGGAVTVDENSLSLDRLNSLRIYMTSVKTLPFNLKIYGDDLFSDQLYMDIGLTSRLVNIMANSTLFASVISYKNLKSFLPKTYYTRGSDPKESDYILASRIIQTWIFQSNRSNDHFREPLDLPFEAGHVEIIFQHESAPKGSDWVAVCGHDYKASIESTWRSYLCITKHLMENITRCICPLSGTYVVMLTKKQQNQSTFAQSLQSPIFIVISCACCLLQSSSALLILLPIWYNRKSAITFLKMQFCFSTSSVMIIFLLGFLKMLPVHWQAVISSSLASLLLLGVSTLIAIALVIHTELVPKKYLPINKSATNPRSNTTMASSSIKMMSTSSSSTLPRKGPVTTVLPLSQHEKRRNSISASGGCVSVAGSMITNSEGSLSALTNMTQISNNSNTTVGNVSSPAGQFTNKKNTSTQLSASTSSITTVYQLPPSGVCAAIGISWLLPLLFALASPLICSIIGKWPQNWWLEILVNTASQLNSVDGSTTGEDVYNFGYFNTGYDSKMDTTTTSLLNGDQLYEIFQQNATTVTTILSATTIRTTTKSLGDDDLLTKSSASNSYSPWLLSHTYTGNFSHISATHQHQYQHNFYGDANNKVPSLSFIIFISVDLLFVLLFVALFVILIKKLLWLWHNNEQKNRKSTENTIASGGGTSIANQMHHQHHRHQPVDKFNLAMKRRIGLLYRSGFLLLFKLSTDILFIAYANSSQDIFLGYSLGILCILLGFTILLCFIIKPEYNLRDQARSHSNAGSNSSANNLKKKLSSSKNSLDENYCTSAINSPLSFYTNHEKEKDNDASAPAPPHLASLVAKTPPPSLMARTSQQIDMTTGGVQLPLTIISAAPSRCQLLTASGLHELTSQSTASIETLMGATSQVGGNIPTHLNATATGIASSPATRCCNILGSIVSTAPISQAMTAGALGYFDASNSYTLNNIPIGMTTGSLNRRTTTHPMQQQQHQQLEFLGIETLDILQGVAPDSIIGIRESNMLPTVTASTTNIPHYTQHHHQPFVDSPGNILHHTNHSNIPIIPALSYANSPSINPASNLINSSNNATITTNSVMTQTPKSQKRVTIMEPTTHTFDPMLPTMVAVSGVPTTATSQLLATSINAIPTPIITITGTTTKTAAAATCDDVNTVNSKTIDTTVETPTSDDSSNNGSMFDRITHDLDYLLNRTNEVTIADDTHDNDDVICIPPLMLPSNICMPTQSNQISSSPSASPTCSQISITSSSVSSSSSSSTTTSSASVIAARAISASSQHAVIIEETEAEL